MEPNLWMLVYYPCCWYWLVLYSTKHQFRNIFCQRKQKKTQKGHCSNLWFFSQIKKPQCRVIFMFNNLCDLTFTSTSIYNQAEVHFVSISTIQYYLFRICDWPWSLDVCFGFVLIVFLSHLCVFCFRSLKHFLLPKSLTAAQIICSFTRN